MGINVFSALNMEKKIARIENNNASNDIRDA